MAFSADTRADVELTRELIHLNCAELADPPAGWDASVEEHQLIVIYTHRESSWRKYPQANEVMPSGDHWFCWRCYYPMRWGAIRCWYCDQAQGWSDTNWKYGLGFLPEIEGAPGRRADPGDRRADLGRLADPIAIQFGPRILDAVAPLVIQFGPRILDAAAWRADGGQDDFARAMGRADLGHLADPDPEHLDDFARVMGLGS